MRMKEKLLGKTLTELQEAAVSVGLKPFVGRQLCEWLYIKRVSDWDRMTNIGRSARASLMEKYVLGTSAPVGRAESSDGTVKYLFAVGGQDEATATVNAVEAVMIPEEDRRTLCVSSQAGCKMGCRFCMTGRQGFHGNLDAADILNQFLGIDDPCTLTNTVFMGMGEPLDNFGAVSRAIEVLTADWGFAWSPKRVTLSTIGVLPSLKKYLDSYKCHLAISLHNPFPDERLRMMPAEKAFPSAGVLDLIRQYDFSGQRRVSFEYTMFAGWNDDKRHADALIRLLRGLECRVNLIRFHRIPDFPYDTASPAAMEAFRDRLNNNGIVCTIRKSRGEDILAACGMLAGKHSSH
ncbi:MAG: 23S rRNA (adenine(2503)-C(2))-methyltransferase RlmN [Bacteroidales bacterium]|nr:23S rRNA (adenine(2503)-C(2))-methyltransferase RlmN [Bacteroidales bacterium]